MLVRIEMYAKVKIITTGIAFIVEEIFYTISLSGTNKLVMSAFSDFDLAYIIDSSSRFDKSDWFYFFGTILFWIFNATIGCCFMERDSDAWIHEDRLASKTVPTSRSKVPLDADFRARLQKSCSLNEDIRPLFDALLSPKPNWQSRLSLTRPLRRKLLTEYQIKSLRSKLENMKLIGRGAFGAIYLLTAQDWCGHTNVIVKVDIGSQSEQEVAFEARMLHELDGAGGAPALYGFHPEAGLLMMQYVGPDTFKSVLAREGANAPTDRELLQMVKCTADAISQIHATGLAHCDLHSGNVTFTCTPEGVIEAHIIDLGLSAKIGAPGRIIRSDCHAAIGRWPWYAPEAMKGIVTEKSDIPAIGHLLRLVLLKSSGQISRSDKLWKIVLTAAEKNIDERPRLSRVKLILEWYINNMDE